MRNASRSLLAGLVVAGSVLSLAGVASAQSLAEAYNACKYDYLHRDVQQYLLDECQDLYGPYASFGRFLSRPVYKPHTTRWLNGRHNGWDRGNHNGWGRNRNDHGGNRSSSHSWSGGSHSSAR